MTRMEQEEDEGGTLAVPSFSSSASVANSPACRTPPTLRAARTAKLALARTTLCLNLMMARVVTAATKCPGWAERKTSGSTTVVIPHRQVFPDPNMSKSPRGRAYDVRFVPASDDSTCVSGPSRRVKRNRPLPAIDGKSSASSGTQRRDSSC
jgi:hypothetical protein